MKRIILLFCCLSIFAIGINDAAAQSFVAISPQERDGGTVNGVYPITVLVIGTNGRPSVGNTVNFIGRADGSTKVSLTSDGTFRAGVDVTTDASGQATAYMRIEKNNSDNRAVASALFGLLSRDFTILTSGTAASNTAPAFSTETTTRSIAENSASGTNIGSAVTATDANGDTLRYSLTGTDASSFTLDFSSGQLKTSSALDYEVKNSFTVTVNAYDNKGGSDSITVTISVTNVEETTDPPVITYPRLGQSSDAASSFTLSTTFGTRAVITLKLWDKDGNALANKNVSWSRSPAFLTNNFYSQAQHGSALITATNQDEKLLTTTDANGETTLYYLAIRHQTTTVTVETEDFIEHNDGVSYKETATITVQTTGITAFDSDSVTYSINPGIAALSNVGDPVTARNRQTESLTYSITAGNDGSFSINSSTGQIKTTRVIRYNSDDASANTWTLTVQAATEGGTSHDTIQVTINIDHTSPITFDDTPPIKRSIQENQAVGTNVGSPVTATHSGGETVTYSKVLGVGSPNVFNIDSSTGQITTADRLDYETITSYQLRISAAVSASISISTTVRISVTDDTSDNNAANNAPIFPDGLSTSRSIISEIVTDFSATAGAPVTANDADGDTLTYKITGGSSGHSNFSIDSSTGQLTLNLISNDWLIDKVGNSWTITVEASDPSGAKDSIIVLVTVNNPPEFPDDTPTTLQLTSGNSIGANIGSPITADADSGDTITYSLGGTDAGSFSIDSQSGQLQAGERFNSETKSTYTITVIATNQLGGSNSISITINIVNNSSPVFADGSSTTRTVQDTATAGANVGTPIAASDADGDTITYFLSGGLPVLFQIDRATGQLSTKSALSSQTTFTYTGQVFAIDVLGSGRGPTIDVTVTINKTPAFSEGASTTRSIAENTAAGQNIGSAVTATDPNTGDTLTYSLSGNDAGSFSIVATSGQLRTAAPLDYEKKNNYSVTVNVSDGNGRSGTIDVTINVTDVDETEAPPPADNNAPVFTDGTSTTRSIAENTASNVDIGNPISATDEDSGDTLTYSLSGTDAASFSIVSTSGQLRTVVSLDFETQTAYTVTVNVFDGMGGQDSITVTINITDVDEEGTEPVPPITTTPPSYTGQISFSELMIPSKLGTRSYPQWIELYNNSLTDSVDLSGWTLTIETRDSDGSHRTGEIELDSLPIPANQTALIVTWTGHHTVTLPTNRIYNFFNNHSGDFEQNEHRNMVIGEAGFYLKLEDANGKVIDIAGNLDGDASTTDNPNWNLPKLVKDDNIRVSLLRRYKPKTIVPLDGTNSKNWAPSSEAKLRVFSYWGKANDVGNPGYRGRHPLPVELSHFSVEMSDAGVLIQWTTESEVDNAGFNLYRSITKNGHFVKVNRKLIDGAGTTGERNEYSWIDSTVKQGIEYYYRIEDISFAGDRQLLVTRRLKGVHTAKNRALTSWSAIKQGLSD